MACAKMRPKARKHSIRSNLLFGPKLPFWHVTLSTSFSKNKINTFTLLQQPKSCHFLIAEWLLLIPIRLNWHLGKQLIFCRESKKSGPKLHQTTAVRSLAACPFLLRSVSVEWFPGHAADHQRQRAAQGTGPSPPSPSTPPTGVPETLRPPSPVARVRLWPRIHEQKNSKVSNG